MKAKIFQTHNKGFTLIELLVVVAIIGILAAIVLTALSSAREKTRDAKRISELRQLVNAIEMYRLDNNGNAPLGFCYTYSPSCLDELVDGGYIPAIPQDPTFTSSSSFNYCNYQSSGSNGWCDRLTLNDPQTYVVGFFMEGESGRHCIHATSGVYLGSDKAKGPGESNQACLQEN